MKEKLSTQLPCQFAIANSGVTNDGSLDCPASKCGFITMKHFSLCSFPKLMFPDHSVAIF